MNWYDVNKVLLLEDLQTDSKQEFWADIPGFGVMKEITHKDQILQSFVRTKLTLSLGKTNLPILSKV